MADKYRRRSQEELERQAQKDLSEREQLTIAPGRLRRKLSSHHAESPTLSGGDIDAAWEDSNDSGEESVGGSAPMPDQDSAQDSAQDSVDELGAAAGLTVADDEPLDYDRMASGRDRRRWELVSDSIDDEDDEAEDWTWVDDEEELKTAYEEEAWE